MQHPIRLAVIVGLLLITPPNLYSAQDYIKQNPELDRQMSESSQKDRDQLNKMLSSMPPEERQKFIQEMVDVGLRIERDRITVEKVIAIFRQAPTGQKGLTVTPGRPSSPEPLTQSEIAQLADLPLNGVLEIGQVGRGGVKGATTQIRIVLVMQKPVVTPIEFALPVAGTLMLVQMDDRWVSIPKEYAASTKTIAIKPSRPDVTSVDYDIGNGRQGSEVYFGSR